MRQLPVIETPFPFRLRLRHKNGKQFYTESNVITTHMMLGLAAMGTVPLILMAIVGGGFDPQMIRMYALVLPIVLGLVILAASVAETRRLEYDPETGRVFLLSRKLGRARTLATADAAALRLVIAPVRVLWLPRYSVWWSGHAALFEMNGHVFALCCQKQVEEVEEYLQQCPVWLSRAAVRCEMVRELQGHRRLL